MSTANTSGTAATPRVATRRVARYSPRPFSSPLAAVRNIGRPPIVLEWSNTVVRVGYAEQHQPQHIVPLPQAPFEKFEHYQKTASKDGEVESRWYDVISPIVLKVYDCLMVDPTTRRVVVITQPYPERAWESAMKEALWNLGVPAVAFRNFLEVVPMALACNQGVVIHIGMKESHFLAITDGHPLPFTYQVVPCGYNAAVKDATKIQCQWSEQMDQVWLDECNPNSLVTGLIKCLQECPVDARKGLIGNLLVCGDTSAVVPDLGRKLALKLKRVLNAEESNKENVASSSDAQQQRPDANPLTFIPPVTQRLRPLAEHVGLLSCAPHRSDLISWVGGSVYSTIWHRHDDQSNHVGWVFSPNSATGA